MASYLRVVTIVGSGQCPDMDGGVYTAVPHTTQPEVPSNEILVRAVSNRAVVPGTGVYFVYIYEVIFIQQSIIPVLSYGGTGAEHAPRALRATTAILISTSEVHTYMMLFMSST